MKNKLFPNIDVYSLKEYFALPKNKREKWGIYLKPYALPSDILKENSEEMHGWTAFSKAIRKEYPIQGFIREWLFDMDNPIYAWFMVMKHRYNDIRYAIENFINPNFKRWRASCKRHQYKDISSLIVDSNFALILDFWHEEVSKDRIDWKSDKKHKQFYDWLKKSVNWIEKGRAKKEQKIEELYEIVHSKNTYGQNYGIIDQIETEIHKRDTLILKEMIEYRDFFWT